MMHFNIDAIEKKKKIEASDDFSLFSKATFLKVSCRSPDTRVFQYAFLLSRRALIVDITDNAYAIYP